MPTTLEMPHSKHQREHCRHPEEGRLHHEVTVEWQGQLPKQLKLKLKYQSASAGVIEGLRRVSSPGLRRYVGADRDSPRARRIGQWRLFPRRKALMSGTQARKNKLGGELLCYVW